MDEVRIAVERLAVGERELGALDHRVDERRIRGESAARSKPFSSASCCKATGAWLHGPGLHNVKS